MHTADRDGGRGLVSLLWQRPDPRAVEIGREGEVLMARVRLWTVGIASLIPLHNVLLHPQEAEPWVGLGAALFLLVVGSIVLKVARRTPPRWLGLFSCLLDVTVLSVANATFVLVGHPLAATNGRVFFPVYLLAMVCTCLRQDARLCLLSGLAAILQYGTVVLWAVARMGENVGWNSTYGLFRWDNQIARLMILALATGIEIVIVRQAQGYLSASIHDTLTKLPNRRYAESRLEQAVAQSRRSGRTGILAMVDLDHFKRVNDRYGHAAGDEVLRHTANVLRRHFRASDVVARYGGEEFLILFPETDAAPAIDRLREFHAAFAQEPVYLSGGRRLTATLSMGIAAFPADGLVVPELLERADQRLYLAKQAGRNRIRGPWPEPRAASAAVPGRNEGPLSLRSV